MVEILRVHSHHMDGHNKALKWDRVSLVDFFLEIVLVGQQRSVMRDDETNDFNIESSAIRNRSSVISVWVSWLLFVWVVRSRSLL
jgi:hypothetical protein